MYCTSLKCTKLYCTVKALNGMFLDTILHCIALRLTKLRCITLHCTALQCLSLYLTALHYIAIHWTALHYIALYRINRTPMLCTAGCRVFHHIYCGIQCSSFRCNAVHCSARQGKARQGRGVMFSKVFLYGVRFSEEQCSIMQCFALQWYEV